jgi:hypothetical protein
VSTRLRAYALLVLVFLVPFLTAGGGDLRQQIVVRGTIFPDTLAIVVDGSGSMAGEPFDVAIREAVLIASQATDGSRVRFYHFANDTFSYPPAATSTPGGWIKLPNEEEVACARAFLLSRGAYGNTQMVAALEEILALEENPLGVIVISDAEPDGGGESAAERINAANLRRKAPATIGFIAIEPGKGQADRLGANVARASGGAYVRLVKK